MPLFAKRSRLNAPASRVFAWHQAPDALTKLIPPWEKVKVEKAPKSLRHGERAVLVMRIGPFKKRWVAEHRDFDDRGEAGGEFADFQVSGPFRSWTHRHIVRADSPTTCMLEDFIEYELPGGKLGRLFGGWLARRKLERMFEFRHAATRAEVEKPGNAEAA